MGNYFSHGGTAEDYAPNQDAIINRLQGELIILNERFRFVAQEFEAWKRRMQVDRPPVYEQRVWPDEGDYPSAQGGGPLPDRSYVALAEPGLLTVHLPTLAEELWESAEGPRVGPAEYDYEAAVDGDLLMIRLKGRTQ